MKLICSKTDLAKAVQVVSKAVPTKTSTPILEDILVDASNEMIWLTGNNLELGIKSLVKGDIIEEGSITINAKVFGEIVKKMPAGDVTIESDDSAHASLTCKKIKYDIAVKSGETYPGLPNVEKKQGIEVTEFKIKEAIRQTIFSVADNDSNKMMCGELWEIKGKDLRVIALDGHRISLRNIQLEEEYPPFKVIVPGTTLVEIGKIISGDPEEIIQIFITDSHIMFELKDTIAVSRLIDGEYFKVDQLISLDYETKMKIQRKELQECIDRASLFTKDDSNKPVIINISEKKMKLEIKTKMGALNETLEAEKEGKEIQIGFNPKFLLEMLRVIDDDEISLYFRNSKMPCVVRDEEDSYLYLILPVNIQNAA